MYYLSKFCRICVQTGVKLLDLDTLDFDEVKLSEKLEVCTKMVVSRESLSTEICIQCITKLRISYQFHDMCKKSTNTLQGYLEALLRSNNDDKVNLKEFVNTDLSVTVTPIPSSVRSIETQIVNDNDDNIHSCFRERKKRITKEQRCSLLKRLLMPAEEYKEERPHPYKRDSFFNNSKGGLKNIIHFTKNYEFGFKLDKNSNYESTPLDKLTAFSNDFFRKDFSEFKNTILYIIENKDNFYDSGDSDEEDLFFKCDEAEEDSNSKQSIVKFEEVIVEPDIKIKTEYEYEEEDLMYNCEEPPIDIVCKMEKDDNDVKSEPSMIHNCSSIPTSVPMSPNEYMSSFLNTVPSNPSARIVGGYRHDLRRTFSQSNARCRTRDNPYINPLLKDQFLYRCFKCDRCNRYFKSPGYLKAHYSKVH